MGGLKNCCYCKREKTRKNVINEKLSCSTIKLQASLGANKTKRIKGRERNKPLKGTKKILDLNRLK